MRVTDGPEHLQTEDGTYLDRIRLEDSAYEIVYLRELDDERYALVGEKPNGDRESHVLRTTAERYQGLAPLESDRRDIHDDLQDALSLLGLVVRPTIVEDVHGDSP
jgi:hypothetical protein